MHSYELGVTLTLNGSEKFCRAPLKIRRFEGSEKDVTVLPVTSRPCSLFSFSGL